jgi:hypothetical protein
LPRANEHVFLLHGTDPVPIHRERSRLIGEFLPREHRAENLTEIESTSNRPVPLRRIAADLMAELSTPSFFPEFPRVIVVEQLAELLGAQRREKRTGDTPTRGRKAKKASEPATPPRAGARPKRPHPTTRPSLPFAGFSNATCPKPTTSSSFR